jgi:antitoxin component YwqK of YwqJK toxin-antitoxin module
MDEIKEQKCNYCKVVLPIYKFSTNRADKYLKSCDECRNKQKKTREKNKCPHGKQKCLCKQCGGVSICKHGRERNTCKECGGSSICEHGRRRPVCKECGGASICEHGRQKSQCKECMNDEQKIEYIQKTMISSSRSFDKKKDLYDPDNFIDKCFLEGLFEDYQNCHYCGVDFTYNEKCDTFVTIERLNNTIGHIKSNCVLACFHCNARHQSKE